MKREPEDDVRVAMELATMCQIFHALPRAGGLFDQDPLQLFMIREVLLARREKAEAERGKAGGV
jgi:hypothetical protein